MSFFQQLISRRTMRRPSLCVQRANAATSARVGDLANVVGAARASLAASNNQVSMSIPSLPEVNDGTSAASHRTDGNQQVIHVSGSSEATMVSGVPSLPKRARTLPEVHSAAELAVIDQEVPPLGEKRVESMAPVPEVVMF